MENKKIEVVSSRARSSKRLLNPVLLILIAFVFVMFGGVPGEILSLIFMRTMSPVVINVVFKLGVSFAGITLLIFLYIRFVEKRSFVSIGFEKNGWFRKYIKGFVFSWILMGVTAIIIGGLGEYSIVTSGPNIGLKMLPVVMFTVLGWIIQGGSEEVLTRGWLLTSLSARTNIILAILLNSSLFMALHLFNNSISYIALANLLLFGIFASVYAINEESIWGICGLHSGWNWFQGNVLGIEVSGTKPFGGSLLKLVPGENIIISGGSFGIEASIITTIVLIGITIYYIYCIRRDI